MNLFQIGKIEEEVRRLHFDPAPIQLSWSRLDAKETLSGFWTYHVGPVIKTAKQLAEKYSRADFEIVWLSAIFHDIARIYDREPHDEIGAEMALELLKERGIRISLAFDFQRAIRAHSCKKFKPVYLEDKILATADAMAHFQNSFYVWFAHITSQTFEEQQDSMKHKLDRDFRDKIFFDEEREAVRPYYEMMASWCKFNDVEML